VAEANSISAEECSRKKSRMTLKRREVEWCVSMILCLDEMDLTRRWIVQDGFIERDAMREVRTEVTHDVMYDVFCDALPRILGYKPDASIEFSASISLCFTGLCGCRCM
jgi:hypothetical protein